MIQWRKGVEGAWVAVLGREGTRAEVEQQLDGLVEGWGHKGDEPRKAEAEQALEELRAGASIVTAGHTEFTVRDRADTIQ